MSIITYTDFKGEQNIAGLSNKGTQESLQLFIDEYEPKFLKSLLGNALAEEFITGLAGSGDPVVIDPVWVSLRDMPALKTMLVCYVYYWYVRDAVTLTTGTGETKPANENSTVVSSVNKQVKAWNKMVDLAREFTLDTTVYPSYSENPYAWGNTYKWGILQSWGPKNDIYHRINSLNL